MRAKTRSLLSFMGMGIFGMGILINSELIASVLDSIVGVNKFMTFGFSLVIILIGIGLLYISTGHKSFIHEHRDIFALLVLGSILFVFVYLVM